MPVTLPPPLMLLITLPVTLLLAKLLSASFTCRIVVAVVPPLVMLVKVLFVIVLRGPTPETPSFSSQPATFAPAVNVILEKLFRLFVSVTVLSEPLAAL